MKALSLTQPWATLVSLGAKKIETRSWSTPYRGKLLIHAAKGLGSVGGKRGYKRLCFTEPFLSVLSLARQNTSDVFYLVDYFMSLPFGAIVAVCRLHHCCPTEHIASDWWRKNNLSHSLTDQEYAFGDYSPGRYAWLLADVQALAEPVACKGVLGLWEPDAATMDVVMRQVKV